MGTPQAKTNAVTALHNLSTLSSNLATILSSYPIHPLIAFLKTFNKSSQIAEKCMALLESLLGFEGGRNSVTSVEGGVLTIVEVLEEGSLLSKEYTLLEPF